MAKSTPAKRALAAGLTLVAIGGVLGWLQVPGGMLGLPGLMLCVAAAALSASTPAQPQSGRPPGSQTQGRRGAVMAVSVLGGLILLPLATIGVLLLVGADLLGVLIAAVSLLSLAALLVVTFLAVFFGNVARTRRSANPAARQPTGFGEGSGSISPGH